MLVAKRTFLVALVALVLAGTAGAAAKPRVLAIHVRARPRHQPGHAGLPHAPALPRARRDHYDAAVILLDTPGGLSTSMKTIFNAELNAKLPVIVYVSPNGARAASAGVWVSEAADVLAMAPTTNIGSSTPIESSRREHRLRPAPEGDQRRRRVADGARAGASPQHDLAGEGGAGRVEPDGDAGAEHERHRHDRADAARAPEPPERLPDEGRAAAVHAASRRRADRHGEAGFVTRLLNTVIDPNLISILFLAGIVGLIFEVIHPGIVLPGALGAVCLVIALYGFSVLNPSWGGVGAHPARRRSPCHRPARDDARRPDHRRPHRARVRAWRCSSRTSRRRTA